MGVLLLAAVLRDHDREYLRVPRLLGAVEGKVFVIFFSLITSIGVCADPFCPILVWALQFYHAVREDLAW